MEKNKTIQFLGTVRSLFYQNTSSDARRELKKKNPTTLLLHRKYGKV